MNLKMSVDSKPTKILPRENPSRRITMKQEDEIEPLITDNSVETVIKKEGYESNPWSVDSVSELLKYCCPECNYIEKNLKLFSNHAQENHEKSSILINDINKMIPKNYSSNSVQVYLNVNKSNFRSGLDLQDDNLKGGIKEEEVFEDYDNSENDVFNAESDPDLAIGKIIDFKRNGNKRKIKTIKRLPSYDDSDSDFQNESEIENEVRVRKRVKKQRKKQINSEGKYTCYYCDDKIQNRKALHKHYEKHLNLNGMFPCRQCDKTYSTFKKISHHMREAHRGPGFCEECNKSFSNHTSLYRHKNNVHGNKKLKKFQCEFCPFSTHARDYLYEHRRGKHEGIRHPNYYKNLGGKKFEGKRNYICGKCNAGFSNKGSMLHHVCGSKKGELGEHLYKCPKCDITSKHGHFITHHKKVHGGFPPGYENIKKVMCDKCPEEFLTNNALRQHKMKQFCHSSTAEKIICDQCGPSESFNHPSYLIIHYRETHGSFPPIYESRTKYTCSECPNIFIEEKSLKAHIRNSHNFDKPSSKNLEKKSWNCKICDKKYSTSMTLKKHVIMEHEGPKFQCDICERKMATEASMKDHKKQVHTKGPCDMCNDNVLYNSFYLKRHKAAAHGLIPEGSFKCQQCPLFFKGNSALVKHISSKHR